MQPQVYVINLDRAPARLAAVTAELGALGWSFTRVGALDGRELGGAALARLAPRPWSRYQARIITPTEIACLASHRAAWQRLLASSEAWALVLEDDIVLGPFVPAAVAVFAGQGVFDLAKLEGISIKTRKSFGARMIAGPPDLYLMETVSAGAAAYCLSRAGAEKLLRITAPMNREVDFFIRQYGTTDLVVGEFRPFPARQDRTDSYIGRERGVKTRRRNLDRLIRSAVRARESIARRWRWRRLAAGRPRMAVSLEGSSRDGFDREV